MQQRLARAKKKMRTSRTERMDCEDGIFGGEGEGEEQGVRNFSAKATLQTQRDYLKWMDGNCADQVGQRDNGKIVSCLNKQKKVQKVLGYLNFRLCDSDILRSLGVDGEIILVTPCLYVDDFA